MYLEPLTGEPEAARRQRSASAVLGIVLAVLLVLGGLVLVGALLLYVYMIGHIGSNK